MLYKIRVRNNKICNDDYLFWCITRNHHEFTNKRYESVKIFSDVYACRHAYITIIINSFVIFSNRRLSFCDIKYTEYMINKLYRASEKT